jgi:hypothetical protein
MLQRRLLITGCVLLALLGLPREGKAGIVEVIIEMSGPQMLGFHFDCRLVLMTGKWDSCGASLPIAAQAGSTVKTWLSVGGGFYFATGADVGGNVHDKGEAYMVTLDPVFEIQSVDKKHGFELYHGVIGLSHNFLWGDAFDSFSNTALLFRPVGIVFPLGSSQKYGLDFAYNLRLYPVGFTPEDFGRPPDGSTGGAEVTHGFAFNFRKYF